MGKLQESRRSQEAACLQKEKGGNHVCGKLGRATVRKPEI